MCISSTHFLLCAFMIESNKCFVLQSPIDSDSAEEGPIPKAVATPTFCK